MTQVDGKKKKEKLVSICFVDKMQKVFPNDEISDDLKSVTALCGVDNAFQFVVNSQKFIWGSELKFKCGIKNLTVRKVEYIPSVVAVREGFDDYIVNDGKSGVYPDALIDFNKNSTFFAPSINYVFYVCFNPSKDEAEKEFEFTIEICDGKNNVLCKNSITIFPQNIKIHSLLQKVSDWIHIDCICDAHCVKPYSQNFYSVFDKYLGLAVGMGVNTMFVPIITPPIDTDMNAERTNVQLIDVVLDGEEYEFGFEKLDYFIKFCLERGIKYLEFCHLYSQWGAERCANVYAKKNGKLKRIFSLKNSVEKSDYEKFLSEMLKALKAYLLKKDLYGISCFHISDEPNVNSKETYKKRKKTVTRIIEEDKIIDALSDYAFYEEGLVKNAVVELDNADVFIERNARPLNVYYCFQHNKNYITNRLFSMPLQRTRMIGIQMYANNVELFLHWGFNFFNSFLSLSKIDPFENSDAGGVLPSGDAFVCYPDKKGKSAFSSLRLEILKQAFLDCRLLQTLESKRGRKFVMNMLEEEKISGFSVYPKSIEWHNGFINKVIRLIKD